MPPSEYASAICWRCIWRHNLLVDRLHSSCGNSDRIFVSCRPFTLRQRWDQQRSGWCSYRSWAPSWQSWPPVALWCFFAGWRWRWRSQHGCRLHIGLAGLPALRIQPKISCQTVRTPWSPYRILTLDFTLEIFKFKMLLIIKSPFLAAYIDFNL